MDPWSGGELVSESIDMRLKRLKRARKVVSFFRSVGNFKPPFNVLVDGTAIQTALNAHVVLEEALPKVLGDKVQLLVPKAVVAELHLLGRTFASAAKFSRRLKVLPSPESASARAAILNLVAHGNPQHCFVMTEDAELRKALVELQGVPMLRFVRGQISVELPGGRSAASSVLVSTPREPSVHAHLRGGGASVGSSRDESSGSGSGDGAAAIKVPMAAAAKKPRSKEPNPLSCKKKKKQGVGRDGDSGVAAAGGGGVEKTIRKQVRRGKKKSANGGAPTEAAANSI